MSGPAGATSRLCRTAVALFAPVVCLSTADAAWCHDARPVSISIVERTEHGYQVDVRIPPSVDPDNQPDISWPQHCAVRQAGRRDVGGTYVQSMLLTCPRGLEGQRITVRFPLFNPSLSTLFRFSPATGPTRTAVLPPDQSEWSVPLATSRKTVARDYVRLGVAHIWAGVDHLLFVGGLLMLARTARRIAVAVTGFTLAHSVTLSLSALGLVHLPLPPIEAAIALSILFLAREVARPDHDSLARRFPLAVSSSFGLLHGFGFAAALGEAGLPREEIATALLCFNAGVEIGQLAFIAVALGLIAGVSRAARWSGLPRVLPTANRAEFLGAYALGVPAAFWLFERLRLL